MKREEGQLHFALLKMAKCQKGPLEQSASTNFVANNNAQGGLYQLLAQSEEVLPIFLIWMVSRFYRKQLLVSEEFIFIVFFIVFLFLPCHMMNKCNENTHCQCSPHLTELLKIPRHVKVLIQTSEVATSVKFDSTSKN